MLTFAGAELPSITQTVLDFVEASSFYDSRIADTNREAGSLQDYPGYSSPVSPDVPLGAFYWPTGAARFGQATFIIDEKTTAAISTGVGTTHSARPLVIDGGPEKITAQMYSLPLKPLSVPGATNRLFVLTLVDDRYYWRLRRADISITEQTTTWAQLISAISVGLAVDISHSGISSDYNKPPASLEAGYQSLPQLLDCVAASTGRVVVRSYSGEVKLQTFDEALIVQRAQKLKQRGILSGGEQQL